MNRKLLYKHSIAGIVLKTMRKSILSRIAAEQRKVESPTPSSRRNCAREVHDGSCS